MLSPFRVARLVANEEFDRLLNEVLMNARPVPLAARVRLSEHGALAASALGLALKRLTQLTWRPEPPAEELARQLIGRQTAEGSFGTVASSACAVAGLIALQDQVRSMPSDVDALPPDLHCQIESALNVGFEWLSRQQTVSECSAHADQSARIGIALRRTGAGSDADAAVDAAILLWQLGGSPVAMDRLGVRSPAAVVDLLGLRHLRATASLVDSLAEATTAAVQPAAGRVRRAA